MRVIDFISLGEENMIYMISEKGSHVDWRGTRKDFVRELSAFFILFYRPVISFDIGGNDVLILYI